MSHVKVPRTHAWMLQSYREDVLQIAAIAKWQFGSRWWPGFRRMLDQLAIDLGYRRVRLDDEPARSSGKWIHEQEWIVLVAQRRCRPRMDFSAARMKVSPERRREIAAAGGRARQSKAVK